MSVGPTGGFDALSQIDTSDTQAAGAGELPRVALSVTGTPGDLNIDVRLQVEGDAVVGGGRDAVIKLAGFDEVESTVEDIIGDVSGSVVNQLPANIRLAALGIDIPSPDDIASDGISIGPFSDLASGEIRISGDSIGSLPRGFNVVNDIQVNVTQVAQDTGIIDSEYTPLQVETIDIRFTIGADFTPIRIPSGIRVGGQSIFSFSGDVTDRLPTFQIEAGLPRGGFFGGNQAVFANVGIPPEAYVDTTPIDISCDDIFRASDILSQTQADSQAVSQLEDLKSQMQTEFSLSGDLPQRVNQVRDRVPTQALDRIRQQFDQQQTPDQVQEFRDQLREINIGDRAPLQNINIPSPCQGELEDINQATALRNEISSFLDALQEISPSLPCADISSAAGSIDNRISSLEQDVESVLNDGPRAPSRAAVLSQLRSLRSEVQSDVDSNRCVNQFQSRLESLRNRLRDRVTTQDIVDCAEVTPRSLQNEIDSFVSETRQFSRLREIERTENRFNRLQSRAESLQSRISREVDESECVQEAIGRVESARSRLQAAGARRPDVVPCGARHQNIEEQIDQFEDNVTNLSAPVSPDTIQEVSRQGQEIIDTIESNIDPGRCRENFISRIRSATGRLEGLQERVQVTVIEDRAEGAQESLDQLLDQINRIEIRGGGRSSSDGRDSIL